MKSKSFTPMGSLHPILFFAGLYVVALLFSIFICSSLFYSCNARPAKIGSTRTIPVEKQAEPAATVAMR
ncbi:MAG TPA: hypothetical protein VGO58_10245 [Chitinophagaceae bacterium]|jgi:hypothetical protein|nr:hypothetical protein [Chitinophagaceae bacterium]